MGVKLGLLFSLVFICEFVHDARAKPNIVFIVTDDMGWNDIGFHNSEIKTPNIDRLAGEGMILNMSYAQPICTPSRSAYLSGWYPFKTGMQHATIEDKQPDCASFPSGTLPQALKTEGYTTRMIGKWHLGFCKWECTPTYLGFDSFFGFYNGAEGFMSHKHAGYLDFREDESATNNYRGEYSTTLFGNKAVEIIESHNTANPLFLYLAFQAPHLPMDVPSEYEDQYSQVTVAGRRKFQGMVTAIDDAVSDVYDALVAREMEANTLIVFTSDNGGNLQGYGNNWPLRGGKATIWEGGTRVPGFVHGYGLQNTGITWNGMIHAVDWMPTFITAAIGTPPDGLDGVSQWDALQAGGSSARTSFIYNIDTKKVPKQGRAAIRMGDFKLIEGYPGAYDGWYQPFTDSEDNITTLVYRDRKQSDVMLFNIADDPEETNDISLTDNTGQVAKLTEELHLQMAKMVAPVSSDLDPQADPRNYNDVWSPGWCT
ncbi:arylsulfatase B-like [Gigantopelta aegis]|uniref:arylsulfatase B-like n=1 Tax=Gigantopelta aegis TaxID=1735272 RepID=UPI001B88C89A|nr:arylsulfatase B-like [Gigantopelta aegis]